MDDLFKALQMYGDGVKQFQVGQSIRSANDQVQQIRASEENEANKRAQLQQIANNLTLQLAAQGTPATTLQAVGGAIGPEKIASADDALIAGALAPAGSEKQKSLIEAGTSVLNTQTEAALQKIEKKGEQDINKIKAQLEAAKAKETTKAEAKALELDKPSTAILVDNKALVSGLNDLEDSLDKIPNIDRVLGGVGGSRVSPELSKLKAQVATSFATYLNSTSGKQVSDQERKEILRKLAQNKVGALADALEPQGKNVKGIRDMVASFERQAPKQKMPAGIPEGSVKKKVRFNGKTVDAWKTPDGKYLQEK
jgi:hypothetical protein